MAIRILSSENITGNITLYHPSNAPYINFVENTDISDSKARITMDQVDTNNGTLLFATENAGTLYNQVKITQTGNLLLSNDAASFNTSNAKLNVLPASSGVYQQWNYSPSNENFSLKLKETVTSGNVRYVFEQINNSTTYSNILVFNSGNVGIGTDEPGSKLEVAVADSSSILELTRTGAASFSTLISDVGAGAAQLWFNADTDDTGFLFRPRDSAGTPNNAFLIAPDGNVGIGTTSPDQTGYGYKTLTIMGGTTAGYAGVLELLTPSTDANGQNLGIVSFGSGGTRNAMIAAVRQSGNNNAKLQFWTAAGANGIENRMTIDADGQVGIGTDSPSAQLHINNDTSNSYATLRLEGANRGGIIEMYNQTSYPVSSWTTDQSGNIFFATSGAFAATSLSTKFTILTGGNVGIGTTNPEAQLELKKQTTWGTLNNQVIYINNTGTGGDTGALHDMGSITWRSGNVNTAAISGIRNTPGSGNNVDLRFTTATQSGGQQTSMTILSGGNVGIGTESPTYPLTLSGGAANTNPGTVEAPYIGEELAFKIENPGWTSTNGLIRMVQPAGAYVNNASMTFSTEQGSLTEKMRIENNGNVGIGTTSPAEILQTNKNSAGNIVGGYFTNSQANTGAESVSLAFGLNRSGGDFVRQVKAITFGAEQQWTGTPSTVDGYLSFSTVSNETVSERLRITSGGVTQLGGSTSLAAKLAIESYYVYGIFNNSNRPTQQFFQDFRYNGGQIGTILGNNTSVSYNTSSDYRLKEDLKDFAGLDMVSKIKMYDFKWKSDESRSYGVMAHELQEVLPDAVSGEKDAEEMQGVDYSKIVPLLVKSIQELKAEIELLKNK